MQVYILHMNYRCTYVADMCEIHMFYTCNLHITPHMDYSNISSISNHQPHHTIHLERPTVLPLATTSLMTQYTKNVLLYCH